MLKTWGKQRVSMGISVDEHYMLTLFYADDQIVLAECSDDLSCMARKLGECYGTAG